MQQNKQNARSRWSALLFSPTLQNKGTSHKIAYIGLMTAFTVIVNAFENKLGFSQFSLTIFVTVFAGILLGGIAGFSAGFFGDMIGFFLHPMGEYSPWIGIATGLMAFFAALCVYVPKGNGKWLYVKLALACLLIFLCCTCGITTLYFHALYGKGVPYFTYLLVRLFGVGHMQILNSIANTILVVFAIPRLVKIKALEIKL